MMNEVVFFVTVVMGPIAAFGLVKSLLLAPELQEVSTLRRCVLSFAAAGLVVQVIIYLNPSLYAEWWLLKDISLILLSYEVVFGRKTK